MSVNSARDSGSSSTTRMLQLSVMLSWTSFRKPAVAVLKRVEDFGICEALRTAGEDLTQFGILFRHAVNYLPNGLGIQGGPARPPALCAIAVEAWRRASRRSAATGSVGDCLPGLPRVNSARRADGPCSRRFPPAGMVFVQNHPGPQPKHPLAAGRTPKQ